MEYTVPKLKTIPVSFDSLEIGDYFYFGEMEFVKAKDNKGQSTTQLYSRWFNSKEIVGKEV